jgi:hypothetical protein
MLPVQLTSFEREYSGMLLFSTMLRSPSQSQLKHLIAAAFLIVFAYSFLLPRIGTHGHFFGFEPPSKHPLPRDAAANTTLGVSPSIFSCGLSRPGPNLINSFKRSSLYQYIPVGVHEAWRPLPCLRTSQSKFQSIPMYPTN